MKTDPLHGDLFSFCPVYSFRHALFVRIKNVFELPAVGRAEGATKQLNRRRLYDQE
jgi:hypothetical protein